MQYQILVVTPKGAAHDRITVLEPRVDVESAGVVVLESQKYQYSWGIVIGGEPSNLMSFCTQLDQLESTWAQLDEKELLDKLSQFSKDMGLHVVHIHEPVPANSGLNSIPYGVMKGFGIGPDVLARVLSEVKHELEIRGANKKEVQYPKNINPKAKAIWLLVLDRFKHLFKNEYNEQAIQLAIFEDICHRRKLMPFTTSQSNHNRDELIRKLNINWGKADILANEIMRTLGYDFDPIQFNSVGEDSNRVFFSFCYMTKLPDDFIPERVINQYAFRISNRYPSFWLKNIDSSTDLGMKIDSKLHFIIFSYLNFDQARYILDLDSDSSVNKILRSLKSACQDWVTENDLKLI